MSKASDLIKSISETYFSVGDEAISNTTAQGMEKGKKYRIIDLERGKFGTVTYKIEGEDKKPLWVVNAHLLLDKA